MFLMYVFTLADVLCCAWFMQPILLCCWYSAIETNYIDWAQVSRFTWRRRQNPISETLRLK